MTYIPVNPCKDCRKQLMAQMESTFDFLGNCRCLIQMVYEKEMDAQKKLWQHLMGSCTGHGACRSVLCDDENMTVKNCPRLLCPSCIKEVNEVLGNK